MSLWNLSNLDVDLCRSLVENRTVMVFSVRCKDLYSIVPVPAWLCRRWLFCRDGCAEGNFPTKGIECHFVYKVFCFEIAKFLLWQFCVSLCWKQTSLFAGPWSSVLTFGNINFVTPSHERGVKPLVPVGATGEEVSYNPYVLHLTALLQQTITFVIC